jgi:hypothetical protein
MKKQAIAAFALALFIATALFIDAGNAATQTSLTLQSNGTITIGDHQKSKPEFLIRYVWIGSLTSAEEVDAYVAAHPWGTGILLTDLSSSILSVISYTGWNASQKWQDIYGGITYAQLKTVIDEFHNLCWKVIYSPGNTPTSSDRYIYEYLTKQHPELIAVAGNGDRYDQIHDRSVMVNFFANYTTPDASRKIEAGDKLSDLYISRLKQMVADGSFLWDGWFGVDGWSGFTNQGLYWVWSTNQPFGRWIGTNDLSKWYCGDDQSIQEWSKSTYAKNLPSDWSIITTAQKISWITSNANLEWWQYWQEKFAIFYAEINHIFDNRPEDLKVGSIISQDFSSTWADNGINNPTGMENLTMFAQYNSFNHYYIDCEWYNWAQIGQYQAYVAGLVKSKIPEAHCISGVNIGLGIADFVWKQEYLAQIETYVWKDGLRYRAVDPNWILVWAGTTTTWDDKEAHGQEMANWITSISNIFDYSITPKWLGPVEVLPIYHYAWCAGPFSVNFTFAQYTDALNLIILEALLSRVWARFFLTHFVTMETSWVEMCTQTYLVNTQRVI